MHLILIHIHAKPAGVVAKQIPIILPDIYVWQQRPTRLKSTFIGEPPEANPQVVEQYFLLKCCEGGVSEEVKGTVNGSGYRSMQDIMIAIQTPSLGLVQQHNCGRTQFQHRFREVLISKQFQ